MSSSRLAFVASLVCTASLLFSTAAPAADALSRCDAASGPGVRPLRPWIATLLATQAPRSPTLRRLIDTVRRYCLIVHVDESGDLNVTWDGRIRFAGSSAGYGYLRVELRRLPASFAASVLAHELQHAAEIGSAQVAAAADFVQLFRTIGFAVPDAPEGQYDTAAAIAAGVATLSELTGRPARAVAGAQRRASTRTHYARTSR